MNTTKPTVSGEILSQPINDAFSQLIDNDIELQSNVDTVQNNLQSHINDQTDAHGSNSINNESSVNGDTVTNALETVQQQVNALVVGGVINTTIGVYSLNLTGSVNAYTATFAGLTYFGGLKLNATVNITNTGSSTINLNGLGIKNVKKKSALGTKVDLIGGDMPIGNIVQLEYDGVDFILLQEVKTVTQYNLTLYPSNQVKSITDSTDGIADVEVGGATFNNQTKITVNQTYAQSGTGGRIFAKTDGVVELGVSYNAARQTVNVKSGEKWFIMAQTDAKTLYGQGGLVYSDNSVDVYPINTPPNNLNLTYGIVTATKSLKANVFVNDNSAAVVATTKLLNFASINLSALSLDSLTANQCLYMINKYFEGFQGSNEFTLKSVGKNLFDGKFDTSETNLTVTSYNSKTFTLKNTGGTAGAITKNILPNVKFMKNTIYTFSGKSFELDDAKNLRLGIKYTDGTNADMFIPTLIETAFVFKSEVGKTVDFIYYVLSSVDGETTVKDLQIEQSSTATAYEPYKGRKLTVKGFNRHKLPNGVQDWFMQKRGYTWAVRNIFSGTDGKGYALQSADIVEISTSGTNRDTVRISKQANMKIYGDSSFTVEAMQTVAFPGFKAALFSDDANSPYTMWNSAATEFQIAVPKGTYADVAAARTDLVTNKQTKILYQLATPQYIPFEDFGANGIETTGVASSFSGYTNIALTSLDITPEMIYTYSMDYGASIYTLKENVATSLELSKTAINMIDQPWQSWTPTVTWTTANPITPTIVSRYKQIGTTVHFNMWITSTNGNGATNVTISLPVSPKNNSTTISLNSQEKVNTTWTSPMGRVLDSSNNITFVAFSTATALQSFELLVSGSYEVL